MKTQLLWRVGPGFTFAVKDKYCIRGILDDVEEEWIYSIWKALAKNGNSVRQNQWEYICHGAHSYENVNNMRIAAEANLRKILTKEEV
jgi:hypothetical protein